MTWLDTVLAKKILGLLFRRALVVVGTLLLAAHCLGTTVCQTFAQYLDLHSDQIVEFAVGSILLLVSVLLSYVEKVKTRNQVKNLELNNERGRGAA